jgi:hypothetical protein
MTQDFVAQGDSNFTAIRYYTQFDPYFYSVDNRPLQDIETNLKDIRSGGADAARRGVLISSLAQSMLQKYLITPGATRFVTGLEVSSPSTNAIRVAQGAVYENHIISSGSTISVVKQAIKLTDSDFTFTPPVTVTHAQTFTIEGKFLELTSGDMAASTLPYLDAANAYLPSTLIPGELKLQINVASVSAVAGSQTPPATTSGWFPIYNVTFTQGVTNPVVSAHANSPEMAGLYKSVRPVAHTTGGAAQSIIDDSIANTFADAATSSVLLPLALGPESLNPFKPIKVKLSVSTTITGGNWALRLRYKGLSAGDLTTSARTSSIIAATAVTAAASAVQLVTLSTITIPNTEFSGFVNGNWVINRDRLVAILDRVGADVADTNTGVMNLFEVELFQ